MPVCLFASSESPKKIRLIYAGSDVRIGRHILFIIQQDEWMMSDGPVNGSRHEHQDHANEAKMVFRAASHKSELDRFAPTTMKTAGFRVTHTSRQFHGSGEIHAYFRRRMRIGTKRDRHAIFKR